MKDKIMQIGTGDEAIKKTLVEMKRLALRDSTSPEITKIARTIRARCKNESEPTECEMLAAFNWVVDNIKYEFDDILLNKMKSKFDRSNQNLIEKGAKQIEFLTAPKYLVAKTRIGDCDDMACLYASICVALGIPVQFKVIAWRMNAYTHVYTEVGITKDGKGYWIPADPVLGTFGKEKEKLIRWEVFRVY